MSEAARECFLADVRAWAAMKALADEAEALEARVAALTEALRYAQFFITVSLPLIDRHGSGEGIEIGGEVLAKIEALIGPYETGMLRAAAADPEGPSGK